MMAVLSLCLPTCEDKPLSVHVNGLSSFKGRKRSSGGPLLNPFNGLLQSVKKRLSFWAWAGLRTLANLYALTKPRYPAKFNPPSQKTKARFSTLGIKGQKAANVRNERAVFLCPSISTALVRLQFILVGCIGQPQGWPAPLTGSANPIQSASNNLALIFGGNLIFKGVSAMRHYAQNPVQIRAGYVSPSRFNLVSATGRILVPSIPLQTAFQLKTNHPTSKIKFSRMVSAGGAL